MSQSVREKSGNSKNILRLISSQLWSQATGLEKLTLQEGMLILEYVPEVLNKHNIYYSKETPKRYKSLVQVKINKV